MESSQNFTLLTGGPGFIGGHIAQLLHKEKRPLRILLRDNSPTKNLSEVKYEKASGDLRDYSSVFRSMRGVDTVYHAAALFALWRRDKNEFDEVNVIGTENMCKAALQAKVKKFIYTSTTGAVGIAFEKNKPCDENMPWNREWTNDPYTLSKYKAEQVVKEYIKKGLNAVILNPTGPVGPGDIHPTPTGKMICDFLKGDIPFYLDAHFSLVDVRDVALGHLLAEKKGRIGERYILSAENLSAKDLFRRLSQMAGFKEPKIKIPHFLIKSFAHVAEWYSNTISYEPPLITKAYTKLLPYYFWFDNSKSISELGLIYRSINRALEDAIAWFKLHKYA